MFFLSELIDFFLIVPDSLGSEDFFLFHFLFSKVRLVDFNGLDESAGGLEGVEQDHEVLGGDVHPVVVTERESFCGLDVLVFDYVLIVV